MAPQSTIVSEGDQSKPPDLRILHFNDVYHVEPGSRDPVGGIARFQTLCDHYRSGKEFENQPALLTFFSGDCFNPSLESTVTKGSHMVPVLNGIGTDVACVGNHDLDLGIPQYQHLTSGCTFPWLVANVFDPSLGKDVLLGNSKPTHMITSSNGIKVGLIGLAEEEWLATVNALPPNLVFKSQLETVKKHAPSLRAQGAEMVIALCHQREVNDNRLATDVPPGMIDIILGGHDHDYRYSKINGVHVLCSGSDFKQLSYLQVRRNSSCGWDWTITRRDVTKDIAENATTLALMDKMFASLNAKLNKSVGYTAAPLDARFSTVRSKESNIGNFVCDILRNYYQGDCCIMAGGTFRGDQIYPPGVLRLKDIMDCFPFEDPTIVLKVRGSAIMDTLQNGVSLYPALEGRFPQVSNITFDFDPSKAAGHRILDVEIGGKKLDPDREYILVTRDYMAQGGDGFSSLLTVERGGSAISLVDEENGMLVSMLLRQYFMSLKVLGRWKNWHAGLGRHWGKVHDTMHEAHPVREPVDPSDQEGTATLAKPRPEQATQGQGVPSLVGKALRSGKVQKPVDQHDEAHLSESEDDSTDVPAVAMEPSERERNLVIMRRVMRKWWRVAGMHGHPAMCEEQGEEFGVHWTRGICPRVEGRIRMVGAQA